MDNTQLIIDWIALIVVGLALDIGAYIFLRADWRRSGVARTDVFFNWLLDKLRQTRNAVKQRVATGLVQYYQESALQPEVATPAPTSGSASSPELEPVLAGPPVEIIPISVENVGQMRHIQFTIDLPLDSQVDVRIGATNEAGVTVQKREL